MIEQGQHHIVQTQIRSGLHSGPERLDESFYGCIGLRQGRDTQEHSGWHGAFRFPLVGLHQLDHALRFEHNRLHGLVHHQTMALVAIGIDPRRSFSGQGQLPLNDVLSGGLGRRHAQHLNAATHGLVVCIRGFMEDLQLHDKTSKYSVCTACARPMFSSTNFSK